MGIQQTIDCFVLDVFVHGYNNPWIKCEGIQSQKMTGAFTRIAYHIDGLMQERCNSIANALELHLSGNNLSNMAATED